MRTISLSKLRRMKGRTDYKRLRATTNEQIEKQISGDHDLRVLRRANVAKGKLVVPVNKGGKS